MVKETEINNNEFIPTSGMVLVGLQEMSFSTETDGHKEEISGCMLYWLYPISSNSNVIGRQVASEFRRNTSASDWSINSTYEPNIVLSVVKGKPVPKIDGYKIVK